MVPHVGPLRPNMRRRRQAEGARPTVARIHNPVFSSAMIRAATQSSQPTTGNGGTPSGAAGSPFTHAAPEGAAKKTGEVPGNQHAEIVWLMSQSPLHKRFFIEDLEWFVMTPVLMQQFRIFYDTTKPIGVVLWALADDDVAMRLAEGTTKMRPQDWQSGDQPWVVEVIAPFGGAEEMIKDTKANVFGARELRYLVTTAAGKEVRGA